MYISRTIQDKIFKTSHFFPVLLVNGPRQSGKTTVLKHCMQATNEPQRNYVTLDTLENRELAVRDPALFLQRFPAPLLIDEIQYAPELLPYIKAIVDEKNQAGMYWITGSQQFRLMKNVSESLAGRIGILNLQGFSQSEKFGCPATPVFLPDSNYLEQQSAKRPKQDLRTIYEIIWKGSFPKLWTAENEQWKTYYDSLVQTYLERDIRDLTSISDELIFVKFLKVIAARTGQLINFTEVAKDIGVSQPTVKSWLSVLQTSGLVYLLQPYYAEVVLKSIKQNTASAATRSGCSRAKPIALPATVYKNRTSRVIKTPKLYFLDTGLVSYLTGWKTPEVLESGAMAGAIFETYVVSEILKSYWHQGEEPNIYFYRDRDNIEIDVVLEENGLLYPIEIKKKSNPDKSDIKNFKVLTKLNQPIGQGAVVCLAPTHLPLTEKTNIIPVWYI